VNSSFEVHVCDQFYFGWIVSRCYGVLERKAFTECGELQPAEQTAGGANFKEKRVRSAAVPLLLGNIDFTYVTPYVTQQSSLNGQALASQ
jgi:hypothetical protein